jgi:outer membrane protein TolC
MKKRLIIYHTFIFLFLFNAFSVPHSYSSAKEEAMSLEDAIELALARNKELRYMSVNQRISEEQLALGYRQFFPSIEFGWNHNDSVTYGTTDTRTKQLSIGVSQLIFDAGRRASRMKIKETETKLNIYSITLKKEEIIFSVINLYIEIIKSMHKKEIQQEILNTSKIQHRIAREEVRLGTMTEIEFLDINVSLKDLEIELENTEQEHRLLLFQFARLCGCNPDAVIPVPTGTINPEFNGFIEQREPMYWLKQSQRYSVEFIKKRFEISLLNETLQKSRFSWLPEISCRFTLSFSGNQYPLTEPGFSMGIDISFDLPVIPVKTGASIGKRTPNERSMGFSTSAGIAENIEYFYSQELAALNLAEAENALEDYQSELRFAIEESLITIENHKKMLSLLNEKYEIEQKRLEIQKLKLELGQIQRIDYLTTEIDMARLRITILSYIVSLYNSEISLLRMCGITDICETYHFIILEQEGERSP